MKNKKTFLILAIIFVILIIGASILYKNLSSTVENNNLAVQNTEETAPAQEITEAHETTTSTAKSQKQMPDFSITDKDGNTVQLSDYFGKPIILNFWASWCGPCKSEMPDFQEAYEKYGNDIEFLMVNLTDNSRETTETAQDFIQKQGYTFPVYFDTEQNAAITYAVYSIPTTYFIDENGVGVTKARGAINGETLQTGIEMIYPKALAQSLLTQ